MIGQLPILNFYWSPITLLPAFSNYKLLSFKLRKLSVCKFNFGTESFAQKSLGTKDQLSGGSGGAAATAGSHVNWSRCPGCGHLLLALADHPHAAHDPYHDVGEDDVAEIARDHETVPQLLPSKTPSNPNSTSALSNTKTSITPHWSSTSPRFSTISFRIPVPCDQCNKTSKNSKNLNYVPCCINSELVTEADVNCGSDKTRSILEEVLSWRRTFSEGHETHKSSHSLKLRPKPSLHHSIAPNCLSLKYIFLILSLGKHNYKNTSKDHLLRKFR